MTEYGTEYFRGDVGEMKNEILKLLLDESNCYSSSSDNIASIQNIIDNNIAKHDVGRLSKERILELKELLNERITTLSNSRLN
jgi:protein-arginine kinase activator protein McsA